MHTRNGTHIQTFVRDGSGNEITTSKNGKKGDPVWMCCALPSHVVGGGGGGCLLNKQKI